MTTAQIYQALGYALAKLDDPASATAEGFFGGRKQVRLLRTTHARASSLDPARLSDLGRLVYDNVSPQSQIAKLHEDLLASLSNREPGS